jgi:hypothetical protein
MTNRSRELDAAATDAHVAAETLNRAVAKARTAGLLVDDEVFECAAAVNSWAAWLAAQATQANGGDAAGP